MRKKNFKGRCEKRTVPKVEGICATYDKIQYATADYLALQDEITEIRCNVWLEGLGLDTEYMSDFVCVKRDGDLLVRGVCIPKVSDKA